MLDWSIELFSPCATCREGDIASLLCVCVYMCASPLGYGQDPKKTLARMCIEFRTTVCYGKKNHLFPIKLDKHLFKDRLTNTIFNMNYRCDLTVETFDSLLQN